MKKQQQTVRLQNGANGERIEYPEIDFKEPTGCGGSVKYTVDPDTDFITYTCFSDKCQAGIICKGCSWHNHCQKYTELKDYFTKRG